MFCVRAFSGRCNRLLGVNVYLRVFSLHQENEPETREVKQFHFTAWPDHGVPEDVTAILDFRKRVRTNNLAHTGPLVVHCR